MPVPENYSLEMGKMGLLQYSVAAKYYACHLCCPVFWFIQFIHHSNSYFYSDFWPCHTPCRISVPWPGTQPGPQQWKPEILLGAQEVLLVQSCLTLCNPMDCSPPGSTDHGILQARILWWVAISFFRGSSWPRDRTQVSCIASRHND